MVDYTTKDKSGSGSIWLYLVAGAIVVVLLYALFAGGGGTGSIDPATLAPADSGAVAPDAGAETAPLVTE